MKVIQDILSQTTHRPFELPKGNWAYYQEWNRVLFLHWETSMEDLRKIIPKQLEIDTIYGRPYISLVAFTMENIRPKNFPSIKYISNFDEINLRTYVSHNGRKGVYFLNIESGKLLSSLIAKTLSGLPYETSKIRRSNNRYQSILKQKKFYFDIEFETKELLREKTELDYWLTERYCLYLDDHQTIYRYDIHHKEWNIQKLDIRHLDLSYKIGEIDINAPADLAHYSKGVKVLAWKRVPIGTTK